MALAGKLKQSWPASLCHVEKPKPHTAEASIDWMNSTEEQQFQMGRPEGAGVMALTLICHVAGTGSIPESYNQMFLPVG